MSEEKARDYLMQAEKKMKSSGGFLGNILGTNNIKFEEAAELYKNAGNSFKMAKKWKEAGDAFVECAKLSLKLESKHEGASNYIEAANCYKKTKGEAAITALQLAVDIYTDMGRFNMAAKQQQAIAEMYETEIVDLEKAIEAYEKASEWFIADESTSASNKCLLKVATFSAQLGKYERAIEIYQQVGRASIENNLLKYSAKEYFLKGGLCILCTGDLVRAQNAIETFESMFPSFTDTRECKLLKDLAKSVENSDVDAFTSVVAEYDSLSRLDAWMTGILLVIKRTMGAGNASGNGEQSEPLC